jgi:dipeptidyl aminopeptidase/acylaminoacyl peptidase
MRHALLTAALMVVSACLPVAARSASQPATPIIPRAALFGNPSHAGATLSPDGKWLAWMAPKGGVMALWIAPVAHSMKAQLMTDGVARSISGFMWSPDAAALLYLSDTAGDENFLLYKVTLKTRKEKLLTPFTNSRVAFNASSTRITDHILITANDRDARWDDVYDLDIVRDKLTKVFENRGSYSGFIADDSLVLRIASRSRPDGGEDFFHVVKNRVDDRPFEGVEPKDALTTAPHAYTKDGATLYWLDSRGRDTSAIVEQDVATGRMRVVAESSKADLGTVLMDPTTGRLQAYAVNYLTKEWVALDPLVVSDLAFLKTELKGQFYVTSRSDADDLWTVAADPVTAPSTSYLYRRADKTLTKLFVSRPALAKAALSPMYPQEIRARDGLTLVSYLTLPPGSDTAHPGQPDAPLPMVLFVHGGPWLRDEYGYNPYHQWLANRGYAVLSVNFRGSTGFGKRFLDAGALQWGARMQDDLNDAVAWAVERNIATPGKVAIMGGSYGGYATLAGLAFTPDAFACGVDVVGPSNLQTLLDTLPPYWEVGKALLYTRMGDPTTPEGRQMLQERSPLNKAQAITRPLLIGQGANDPRVKQSESDQIVKAMTARHIPVTYIVFPDEGHGFTRPDNDIAFNAVAEQFLGTCLGGRIEPMGDALRSSSATVPEGARFVPGLEEALDRSL